MAYLSLQQHIDDPKNDELIRVLKERDKKGKAEKLSIITINGAVSLPEELIIEILSRLPVKTLLQFKSASKLWYTIIISHSFIYKHLRNYYDKNQPDMEYCFLTLERITQGGEVDFRARFVDETLEIYANSRIKEAPLQHFEICGPCNGIYLLYGIWDGDCLWNPTINDLKILPLLIMKPDLPECLTYLGSETYGFGYDPLTDDYKVVIIKQYQSKDGFPYLDKNKQYEYPPSVFVYSLKTDSWKYWGDLPQFYDRLENNKTHMFVNGCLYWVGGRWGDEFEAIISFNIVTNVLEEIQMPNYVKQSSTSLGIYKDSIALYTIHGTHNNEGEVYECFNVWTFKEGCWTKKFTIGGLEPYVDTVGHLKNDMALLKYDSDLVLCDPDTEDMWDIIKMEVPGRGFQSVVVYMESLVSISRLSTQACNMT